MVLYWLKSILGQRTTFGRRRRNRRVVLYASAGCVLAAAVLMVLLWQGNAPAPSENAVQVLTEPGGAPAAGAPESNPEPSLTPGPALVVITPPPTLAPTLAPSPPATAQPTPAAAPTAAPLDYDQVISFYEVTEDKYYNDFGFSSNSYAYTDNDVYMLAQLIHGEARGESTKGKIAVGNVVMNRLLARGYPGSTLEEVITAARQFTGYSSSIKPNSSCKSAARQVLEKEVWVIPQNVYFFNSDKPEGENWGSHRFYVKIGGHCFYTESYSGRSRNDAIPPALFQRTFKWPQFGCEPGQRVYRIQYMLNKLGYDVKADKYFGKTTQEALIKFQLAQKIEADGVAGPRTIKALIQAYGAAAYAAKFL